MTTKQRKALAAWLDQLADDLEDGLAPPPDATNGYGSPIYRSGPFSFVGYPEPLREAARLIRRALRSPGPPAFAITPEATVDDARRLYGDNAAPVLRRHLETLDPEDYHGPAVRRWTKALALLDAENNQFTRVSRVGAFVTLRGYYLTKVAGTAPGRKITVDHGDGRTEERRPSELEPLEQ